MSSSLGNCNRISPTIYGRLKTALNNVNIATLHFGLRVTIA